MAPNDAAWPPGEGLGRLKIIQLNNYPLAIPLVFAKGTAGSRLTCR